MSLAHKCPLRSESSSRFKSEAEGVKVAAQRRSSLGHRHKVISQPSVAAVCSLKASGKMRRAVGTLGRGRFSIREHLELYSWLFDLRPQSKMHPGTNCETVKPLHGALQSARHTASTFICFQPPSRCGTMIIEAQQSDVQFFFSRKLPSISVHPCVDMV